MKNAALAGGVDAKVRKFDPIATMLWQIQPRASP
jgi:hypothetical protein